MDLKIFLNDLLLTSYDWPSGQRLPVFGEVLSIDGHTYRVTEVTWELITQSDFVSGSGLSAYVDVTVWTPTVEEGE